MATYVETMDTGAEHAMLLDWINATLNINISNIEEVYSGVIHLQLMDLAHPGIVPIESVKFDAQNEDDVGRNFQVLQEVFDTLKIKKNIDLKSLVKKSPLDNFVLLLWIQRYIELPALLSQTTTELDALHQRVTGSIANSRGFVENLSERDLYVLEPKNFAFVMVGVLDNMCDNVLGIDRSRSACIRNLGKVLAVVYNDPNEDNFWDILNELPERRNFSLEDSRVNHLDPKQPRDVIADQLKYDAFKFMKYLQVEWVYIRRLRGLLMHKSREQISEKEFHEAILNCLREWRNKIDLFKTKRSVIIKKIMRFLLGPPATVEDAVEGYLERKLAGRGGMLQRLSSYLDSFSGLLKMNRKNGSSSSTDPKVTTPTSSGIPAHDEEIIELKLSVESLKKERDINAEKLRGIDRLCQNSDSLSVDQVKRIIEDAPESTSGEERC